MSNASLTAKHRPQTFADVAGQDTLKAILSRASAENKVAPAYLFSGTRGVGKTTLARIFAKALNCRNAPTAEPCNNCDQCHAVTMGNAVDVIEIDGASNRGIDDVRRLKEVVGYAPMEGRYKIFIIDEAHMLSREAFNALLKTLEEPPANVTFIMATTEPHKFPATIISRCQHYVFKRLSDNGLIAHLSSVLHKETISFEESALQLIARRGAGSVRDSMSLLGQVLALGTGELTEEMTRSVLGLAGQDALLHMAEALAEGQTLTVAHTVGELMDQGLDIGFFLRELTALWRNLFVLRQSGEAGKTVIDAPEAQKNTLLELSSRFSLSHIHACWQMTIEGQRRVLTSMEPGLALELLLMNLAMLPQLLSLDGLSVMARRTMPPAPQGAPPLGGNRGPTGATNRPQSVPSAPPSAAPDAVPIQRKGAPSGSGTHAPTSPPSGDVLGQSSPSSFSAHTTMMQKQEMKAEREEQKEAQVSLQTEQGQKDSSAEMPQAGVQNRLQENTVPWATEESSTTNTEEQLPQNTQNTPIASPLDEHSSHAQDRFLSARTGNSNLSENEDNMAIFENGDNTADSTENISSHESTGNNALAGMQKEQHPLHTEANEPPTHEAQSVDYAVEKEAPLEAVSNTLHEQSLANQPSVQNSDRTYAEWRVLVDWCVEHDLPPWFMPLVKSVTATWDGDTLLLQPTDAFIGQRLMAPGSRVLLDPALTDVYGFLPSITLLQPVKKAIDRTAIKEQVQAHPHIKILEETFDARIVDFGQIQ